jgi:hypothetical protein
LLFDDLDFDASDAPVIPEHLKFANCLIVPARAASSEAVNDIELSYRKFGRPVVVFEEDLADGRGPTLANPETVAAYLGVSPIGLTLEAAEALMTVRVSGACRIAALGRPDLPRPGPGLPVTALGPWGGHTTNG